MAHSPYGSLTPTPSEYRVLGMTPPPVGADTWTTAKRRAFANDLTHSPAHRRLRRLQPVQGRQDPRRLAPAGYWCTYSRAWTDTKHVYGLSVTEAEKTDLNSMLDTCP